MNRLPGAADLGFLGGARVTRVFFDEHAAGMVLELGQPGGIYHWRVEQPFELRSSGEVSLLDPEQASSMIPLLFTLGRSVETCTADAKGNIRFGLSGQVVIECGSDDAYEAWQLDGPAGFLVVCLPGGGVAT